MFELVINGYTIDWQMMLYTGLALNILFGLAQQRKTVKRMNEWTKEGREIIAEKFDPDSNKRDRLAKHLGDRSLYKFHQYRGTFSDLSNLKLEDDDCVFSSWAYILTLILNMINLPISIAALPVRGLWGFARLLSGACTNPVQDNKKFSWFIVQIDPKTYYEIDL